MSAPFAPAGVRADLVEDDALLDVVIAAPKGNVLTTALMDEIAETLRARRDAQRLKMVLLYGAGGSFSYGASVSEHRRETAPRLLSSLRGLVREIATYPVPVVALVEGRCLGAGFELALAAHAVLAARGAVFACPEIKLAAVPPVLAALGPIRIGAAWSERMILTGAELDAVRAHALGFVTELAPSEVDPRVFAFDWYRRTLAPLSAFALREATYAARRGAGVLDAVGAPLEALERRYLERLLPSHDAAEGVAAFLDKRPPKWADR